MGLGNLGDNAFKSFDQSQNDTMNSMFKSIDDANKAIAEENKVQAIKKQSGSLGSVVLGDDAAAAAEAAFRGKDTMSSSIIKP